MYWRFCTWNVCNICKWMSNYSTGVIWSELLLGRKLNQSLWLRSQKHHSTILPAPAPNESSFKQFEQTANTVDSPSWTVLTLAHLYSQCFHLKKMQRSVYAVHKCNHKWLTSGWLTNHVNNCSVTVHNIFVSWVNHTLLCTPLKHWGTINAN